MENSKVILRWFNDDSELFDSFLAEEHFQHMDNTNFGPSRNYK